MIGRFVSTLWIYFAVATKVGFTIGLGFVGPEVGSKTEVIMFVAAGGSERFIRGFDWKREVPGWNSAFPSWDSSL